MIRKRLLLACAGAVAVVGLAIGGNAAFAAVTASSSPTLSYCAKVNASGQVVHQTVSSFLTSPSSAGCPAGTKLETTAAQGIQGNPGTNGTNGVLSTKTYDLGGVASVATGGSFFANSTEVGTGPTLAAGTYLVTLNAKATPPSGGTGAVQVFPLVALYNQAKNAAFTGDVLNIGSGGLESGSHATIDSYESGSVMLTLTASTTLHAYAFGYDSDTSAGTYVLDDASLTVVQVNP